jgi:hypothetical protein
LGDLIIRNGAKTISLQTLFGRLNYHMLTVMMAPHINQKKILNDLISWKPYYCTENQSNYEKSRHSFRPYKAEKDFKLLNLMKALLLHRENVQVIKPLNFYTFKSIIKNLFRRQ